MIGTKPRRAPHTPSPAKSSHRSSWSKNNQEEIGELSPKGVCYSQKEKGPKRKSRCENIFSEEIRKRTALTLNSKFINRLFGLYFSRAMRVIRRQCGFD
jgi:hypothetical protein